MTNNDDSSPSAPPMDEEIPVVQATAVPGGVSQSTPLPPRPPPELAVPSGMAIRNGDALELEDLLCIIEHASKTAILSHQPNYGN